MVHHDALIYFPSQATDLSHPVYALYGQSQTTGRFLSAVMFVGTLLEISGSSWAMIRLQPGPRGNICIPGKIPKISLVIYMYVFIFIGDSTMDI